MAASDLRSPQPLRADFTHPNPSIVSAYNICRAAEHVIDSDPIQDSDHWPPDDPTVKTTLVNIRILGHLLSQTRLLSKIAIATVATGILSCKTDSAERDEAVDVEALSALGEVYKNRLLRPFRRFKCPTSNTSSHPSSPSSSSSKFKLTEEELDQLLAEPPRCQPKSRQLALHRDDFRCIVTRVLDISYARELQVPGPLEAQALECCHILPEPPSDEFQGALKSLGYTAIADELATAGKVHSLENTMTMVHVLHNHFARLDLWFEPTEDSDPDPDTESSPGPHRYHLRTLWLLPHGLADGQAVAFRSARPRLAPPDPEYLRIHAACCRVAHMSGVAGLFDELERDLASDPDPATEGAGFARDLYAHLDHLS